MVQQKMKAEILIPAGEIRPFVQRVGIPWNALTFTERLALVKEVLRARATPEAKERLRLINLGVPTATYFKIVGGTV